MPGVVDGFGDRLLMIDNASSDALELLRFRAALVATPGFEQVVDERIARLRALTHPALPAIRGLERLAGDGALVLVSTSAPGQRLSQLLAERRAGDRLHPAFVMWVVSRVLEPLARLHAEGDGIAHGAVTADRIILAPDGQVRLVEHVLGAALRHLDCSAARLWREFGILAPAEERNAPRLDPRGDVFQVGVLALSMLLARRITSVDAELQLPALIDEWSDSSRWQVFREPLRRWLERTLQVGDRPYRSAGDAQAGLAELPPVSATRAVEFLRTDARHATSLPRLVARSPAQDSEEGAQMANRLSIDTGRVHEFVPPPPSMSLIVPDVTVDPVTRPVPAAAPAAQSPRTSSPSASRARTVRYWVVVAATAAAFAQSIVIVVLLVRSPEEAVTAPSTAPPAAALPSLAGQLSQNPLDIPVFAADVVSVTPATAAGIPRAAAPPDPARRNTGANAAAIAQAARNQRDGGVRLAAPIELKVLQGDRVLGSSADGPIVMSAGTHELELINTALGFRMRRAVTFSAGEITPLTVAVPPGRISVNAVPWAEVWIDDRRLGETPLANLEIPIGEHDVVFRHPELGERRQRVVVRADTVTRVSATFDR